MVEQALRDAADRAGATLLNVDLHHFSPNGGISGVADLAESHISIHTWPEISYAAVDVFMCGNAQPHKAIEVLQGVFLPGIGETTLLFAVGGFRFSTAQAVALVVNAGLT